MPLDQDTYRKFILPALGVLETIATRGKSPGTTALAQEDIFRGVAAERARLRREEQDDFYKSSENHRANEELKRKQDKDNKAFEAKAAAIRRAAGIAEIPDEKERIAAARKFMAESDPDTFTQKTAFPPMGIEEVVTRAAKVGEVNDKLAEGRERRAEERRLKQPPSGYRYTASGALEAIPGGPAAGGGAKAEKAPTEEMNKAATFARRMELAESDLAELTAAGFDPTTAANAARSSKWTPNMFNSPEGQRYSNAEQNFATANLRKESGAVIGDDEMARQERLYFPRHGDSPETVKQKARNRAQAFEGMKAAAGQQFENVPSMIPARENTDPRKALAQQAINDPEATEREKAAARRILGMP